MKPAQPEVDCGELPPGSGGGQESSTGDLARTPKVVERSSDRSMLETVPRPGGNVLRRLPRHERLERLCSPLRPLGGDGTDLAAELASPATHLRQDVLGDGRHGSEECLIAPRQIDHWRGMQGAVVRSECRLLAAQVVEAPSGQTARANEPEGIPLEVSSADERLSVTDAGPDRAAYPLGADLKREEPGQPFAVLDHCDSCVVASPADRQREVGREKGAGQRRLILLQGPPGRHLERSQLSWRDNGHLHVSGSVAIGRRPSAFPGSVR